MAIDNQDLQQGLQPTHVQSAEADAFILGSDLLKENPNLLNKYFRQSSRQMTTLQKLGSLGMGSLTKSASDSPYTGHYEKPRIRTTFTVGAIIGAGAAANELVIELSATDMVVTATGSYQSLPRVTDTVQFVAGGRTYWIIDKDITVNPHQITVKADLDSFDPEDEIIEGGIGSIFANVKGEGTGQPKGLRPRRYKYQNTFWITADTEAVTGTHLTTKISWQPVPGSNLLFMEGLHDMEMRNEVSKGGVWMFGRQTDPNNWTQYSDVFEENASIPGTQGLIEFIQQNGYDFQYDPADFGMEDLRALANYFHDVNLGTSDILLLQGYNVNQLIETEMSGKLNYNWVIGLSDRSLSQNVTKNWGVGENRKYNAEGAFINLGITGFALGQFTFMQTSAPEFNNAQGQGAIGYKDWMIAAPFGMASVEGSDNVPYIGYEYRGANGYNRENEVWTKTGAGNRAITGKSDFYKTSELDGCFFYVRSEIAPHFALGDQFAIFRPEGSSAS